MKPIFIGALLFIFGAPVQAAPTFQQWCDTDLGIGLVMLAANRIYGPIASLDNDQYKARSEWVDAAAKKAMDRFKLLTGEEFYDFEGNLPVGWRQRCQLNSQIN